MHRAVLRTQTKVITLTNHNSKQIHVGDANVSAGKRVRAGHDGFKVLPL